MIQRKLQHFPFGPTVTIPFCKGSNKSKRPTSPWAMMRESCIPQASLHDLQQLS